MGTYQITVHSDDAPQITLGQTLAGAKVIELKDISRQNVTAKELAARFGLSEQTIRDKCSTLNVGTSGKFLYDADKAVQLLSANSAKKGRPRKN